MLDESEQMQGKSADIRVQLVDIDRKMVRLVRHDAFVFAHTPVVQSCAVKSCVGSCSIARPPLHAAYGADVRESVFSVFLRLLHG